MWRHAAYCCSLSDEHSTLSYCLTLASHQVRTEKVNKGKTGAHKAELSSALTSILDSEWEKVL